MASQASPAAPPSSSEDVKSPAMDVSAPEKKTIIQKVKGMFGSGKPNADEAPEKLPPVPFFQLFRYATRAERFYLIISTVAAMVHGVLMPLFTVIFGSIIDTFGMTTGTDRNRRDLTDAIGGVAKWFLILAGVAFVAAFFQVRFQLVFAQRVSNRLRRLFFDSLMRQDYTWYDTNDGGELTARVASDVNLIEAGIGDKVSSAVQFVTMFIAGFVIAFIYGPLLTLVVLAIAPLLGIGGALFGKLAAASTSEGLGSYGSAGSVANEAISLIRTVTAYNGQESEAKRYDQQLEKAYKSGVQNAAFSGGALGFTYFIIFSCFAVAFTFGASQVRAGKMEAGDVIVTFFSVFIGTMSIGQAGPAFNAFAVARGAAPRVYEVIERKSEIDPLAEQDGTVLDNFKGNVAFEDVNFNYPKRVVDADEGATRPFVLQGLNLQIPTGTSHALVGSSGCGKSTTVRLIERFYDPEGGRVLFDGVDVRELNVRWLRSQIGYVGQMPTLFMMSIRENIALGAAMEPTTDPETGKAGIKRMEVTEDDIVSAAKKANAHDFIMKLPERYDTMLGERGALLSGGQKQRICIARALVRNPKVLLLDESTSALDARSEKIVQDALEVAAAGRTTVTIAHRLSTIKNADTISVIDNGTVCESGTHSELISKEGGAYKQLVEYQDVARGEDSTDPAVAAEDSAVLMAEKKNESITKTKSMFIGDDDSNDSDGSDPATDPGVLKRAFMLNLKEMPFILVGMIGAGLAGASFPAAAITFSSIINVLFEQDNQDEVRRWSLFFVLIGVVSCVGYFLQIFMLGVSGERLTRKLRAMAFRTLLRQEIGFFDRKENSVGRLTTRLATESNLVKGVTGDLLGAIVLATSTILTGFLVAFLSCWRVALVVSVIFPFMAISEAAQIKLISGFDADANKKFQKAGAIASEAVDNYDTVTATGVQDVFIRRYNKELEGPLQTGQKTAFSAGISFGVAEFLQQALWAIAFWAGSIFVEEDQCDFESLMKAISGLLFAGSALGQAALFTPDVGKSRVAASNIFRLLDHESQIDPTTHTGVSKQITGQVEAKDVEFEYPTRPDVRVLRGLSVDVTPGQTLALVGESGCGKSTLVGLVERFYDPRAGAVRLDGTDAPDYEVGGLRGQMGLVSQEPDLFNRSVRENIAYGLGHAEGTPVTEGQIVEAARAANAHEFIEALPQGYDTEVGVRGGKLSGGQRQRVAIARSLVREPKVLLLDEATSALDAVSERLVQEALDRAAKGRTTIAIAHRLSTIKDADVIGVVQGGKVVEKGTHEQLLKMNGAYAQLVNNQLADKQ